MSDIRTGTVISADGTVIGFDRSGAGPAVILVQGALMNRSDPVMTGIAAGLSRWFTVLNYDRRGRGGSGDTQPYAVEREMAVRVQDILIRRLHLFYELPDQARSVVPRVAARMKQLLAWDDVTEAEELRDYFQIVERGRIKA